MQDENLKIYRKARILHGNVLEKLYDYYKSNDDFFNEQARSFFKERRKSNITSLKFESIELKGSNYSDFISLFIYPNQVMTESIVEVAKEKKLIKNIDNLEMLDSMLNAFTGIFAPIQYDVEENSILLLDLLSDETITIIDEKLVKSIDKVKDLRFFILTRIIKYKDINFMTNSIILDSNKECSKFIKKAKINKLTEFDLYYFGIQYRNKRSNE